MSERPSIPPPPLSPAATPSPPTPPMTDAAAVDHPVHVSAVAQVPSPPAPVLPQVAAPAAPTPVAQTMAPSLPTTAPAPAPPAHTQMPPAFYDPTVLNRPLQQKRRGRGIIRFLFFIVLLGGLAAGGYAGYLYYQEVTADPEFPEVTANPDFESATMTYSQSFAAAVNRSAGQHAYSVRFDVSSSAGVAENLRYTNGSGSVIWGEGRRWYREHPSQDGNWVAADRDVARAIDYGMDSAATTPTIDEVIPPEVRPFVTVHEVEDDPRNGRALQRFDTSLDAAAAKADSSFTLGSLERFWGPIDSSSSGNDVSLIVWVDEAGVVWGWGSQSRDPNLPSESIVFHLSEVSGEDFVPTYPEGVPLGE